MATALVVGQLLLERDCIVPSQEFWRLSVNADTSVNALMSIPFMLSAGRIRTTAHDNAVVGCAWYPSVDVFASTAASDAW
eukprot:6157615-Amphidinium_carterae.1